MPMPKPVKVGLIVLAALLVIGGGTCAGFVAWVKSNEADWRLKGKEQKREGQRFGATRSGEDCLEEAHRRATPCGEMSALKAGTCQAFVGAFLDQCLTASKQGGGVSGSFCDGVPPESSVLGLVAFSKKRCDARGERTEACMKTVQNYAQWCHASREKTEAAPEE